MSSQGSQSIDGNWLPLKPARQAEEEQAKALLAQFSLVVIVFFVIFILLPSLFDGWGIPTPWRWPIWGQIVGIIAVCLLGWIFIDSLIELSKRRISNFH
jgi:protein-S-isoprenylcysteine O-methyltransferase Ste14